MKTNPVGSMPKGPFANRLQKDVQVFRRIRERIQEPNQVPVIV